VQVCVDQTGHRQQTLPVDDLLRCVGGFDVVAVTDGDDLPVIHGNGAGLQDGPLVIEGDGVGTPDDCIDTGGSGGHISFSIMVGRSVDRGRSWRGQHVP
jgi:hypothetical protein